MRLFTSYTYAWYQISALKLSLLSIGVLIGAFWHELFISNATLLTVLTVVAAMSTVYSIYVWRHQLSGTLR
jgi:hypothetical protein